LLAFVFLFHPVVFAQADVQPILVAEKTFEQAAAERGVRSAFLEFLADDAIVFRPSPVNGKKYWNAAADLSSLTYSRNVTHSDISANGILGYTTGNWRLYPKGKSESSAKFGQYVTIWERKPDGKFRASLDIAITHDKLPFTETDRTWRFDRHKDMNKRGWSPADASMNFSRSSMGGARLGGAYARFAAKDVRLLREGEPPILGKKNVVREMRRYVSIEFPANIALFQAADMAYTWNKCAFADSNEGTESGNCLHIWKLRNKKWWIVLGVFSRVPNETPPRLKIAEKRAPKKN
jgi:ketosteroid isomerase-like protein